MLILGKPSKKIKNGSGNERLNQREQAGIIRLGGNIPYKVRSLKIDISIN